MNLKIDRVLPYPPSVAQPYIFTYLPSLEALLLYPPPPQLEKQEQPSKKKFTFKANSNAAPVSEEVFIFEFTRSAWRTQQTKGKFPTRRQFPAVACMGPCLMVYGGKQINPAKQVNDLYCLNLTTWQWKKLFAMEAPNPSPNPQAFALSDDNLLIVGKQLWVFSAKGVNWDMEKGDLPGGIWEKVQGSQIPFQLRCGARLNNDLIIFGWQGNLKASCVNLETKLVSNLAIEGELQGKGERFQIANTSQGKGLLIDGIHFGSFMVQDNIVFFNEWVVSQEVVFDKIALVEIQGRNVNYGISLKKELVLADLFIEKQEAQEEEEEEELPNTARQIEADYMKSSLIEKKVQNDSPFTRSPLKEQQTSASLVKHLGPLLQAEWRKRRILQSKGMLLEDSIKRAQKMVLALCRYGGEEDKRVHINKVRKIRQNLSQSFNRQTYIRKQMQGRPGETNLREHVMRNYGDVDTRFLDFEQDN